MSFSPRWHALFLLSLGAWAHGMNPPVAPSPGPTLSAQAQLTLDNELQEIVKDWKLPGVAIAVVNREQVLLLRGYGLRQVEPPLPMTPDTLVPIGSATKAFSAALIATLVEEGKLDWQAPVRRM
jgi:CubicO group peptidase (beta-lactamase class C family)